MTTQNEFDILMGIKTLSKIIFFSKLNALGLTEDYMIEKIITQTCVNKEEAKAILYKKASEFDQKKYLIENEKSVLNYLIGNSTH